MSTNLFDNKDNALEDISGNIYFTKGTTVPSATAGYAVGCVFIHTDGGVNDTTYVNEGSTTSCSFKAIGKVHSPVASKSAAYTITANDEVLISSGGHATTILFKLPATTAGKKFTFTNNHATCCLAIEGIGALTIGGANTLYFDAASQYTSRTVISDGSNYFVIAGSGDLS